MEERPYHAIICEIPQLFEPEGMTHIRPMIVEGDIFSSRSRQPILPVVKRDSYEVGFTTELWHDGTLMFTYQAATALVDIAEQHAATNPGDWIISDVMLKSDMVQRDMSWGKNVSCLNEKLIILASRIHPEGYEYPGLVEEVWTTRKNENLRIFEAPQRIIAWPSAQKTS